MAKYPTLIYGDEAGFAELTSAFRECGADAGPVTQGAL
jgi:hypothetical protein